MQQRRGSQPGPEGGGVETRPDLPTRPEIGAPPDAPTRPELPVGQSARRAAPANEPALPQISMRATPAEANDPTIEAPRPPIDDSRPMAFVRHFDSRPKSFLQRLPRPAWMTGDKMREWISALRRVPVPRWVLAATGTSVVLVVIALLSIGPIVRSAVEERAHAMGLEVEVGSVGLGLGSVRLRDVTIEAPRVPSLEAAFGVVEVTPTFTLGIGGVAVRGGRVRFAGDIDELKKQLRGEKREARSDSGDGPAIDVEGVDVTWSDAVAVGDTQRIWGARYSRDADGLEQFGADLIRLVWKRAGVELAEARFKMRRSEGRRVLDSMSAERVVAQVDLDGESLGEQPEPSAAPATQTAGQSARRAATATATGKKPSAAAEPAPHRGRALRALLGELGEASEALLVAGGKVDVRGVRVKVLHSGQTLNIGPGRLSVSRDAQHLRVRLVPGEDEQRASLTLAVDVPLGAGSVRMEVDGGPVQLAALGVQEGDMGLVELRRARVEMRGSAELTPDGDAASFSGKVMLSDLSLHDERLADGPVRGIMVSVSGEGAAALDGRWLSLKEAEVTVGKVRGRVTAAIERTEGEARGRLHAEVPLAACQDLLDSVPEALVPLLRGIQFRGTFAFDGKLEFDTAKPADIVVDWNLANECRFTAVPTTVDPHQFKQPWMRSVPGPDREPMSIESGPGSADWTPLRDISRHMETAIIVCEDSRFWAHEGFDFKAIQDSIRDNVKAGRFMRGASTVSMQLAKNLYLARQKTLSRKFQEAALTLLLEQELTKDEILELYLNVIEFGPGIYGVERAARHYFNSSARDLSLGQALYLGSILPNPRQQHFGDDGRVSERWTEYLQRLMHIAHKIHRVTDDELEEALADHVTFGVPYLSESENPYEPPPPTPDPAL